MALATENRSIAFALKLEISAMVYHLAQRWDDARNYRKTVKELSALDARQLADLGLHRSEITRVAYETTYGKRM